MNAPASAPAEAGGSVSAGGSAPSGAVETATGRGSEPNGLERVSLRRVAIALAPLAVLATLIALDVPLCPTRHLFGIPCPGCGLTRATEAMAHGDLAAMVHFHPLAPIFAPLLGLALLRTTLVGAGLWRNRRDAMGRVPSWVWALLVVVLLGLYTARMAGALGGMPDPITPHEGLLYRAGEVLLRALDAG